MTFLWFPRSRASVLDDIRHFSQFAGDLSQAAYPIQLRFHRAELDVANDYRNGTSQHPLSDVNRGEALIKATYEAIRGSAFWGEQSADHHLGRTRWLL